MKHILLLLTLFLCGRFISSAQSETKETDARFRITGYVLNQPSLLNDVKHLDLTQITHLNIAFINPDSTGNIHAPQDIKKVTKLAHQKHVQVLLSIAGGEPPKFILNFLTPDKQASFIASLVKMTTDNELDGIDVDLEGAMIDTNYESFVTNLKLALQAKNKTMTAAIATYYAEQYTDKALQQFDFLNEMSYDKTGPWNPDKPGQHASYAMAKDDIRYWSGVRHIAKQKLGLGLPFYGYGFGAGAPADMSYGDIVTHYPDSANADQVTVPGGGVIYYNGAFTIKGKTKLALHSAGGVMIWQLLQDAGDKHSLLTLIHEQVTKATKE